MSHGSFLWADLSSYRPDVAKGFYAKVLGWASSDYAATVNGAPVAGIYQMPAKFMDMGMPAFWMSYIAVDDIDAAVQIAGEHGGKVEVGPSPFEGGGQFALIRDPLGAGFTVYQGTALTGSAKGAGSRMGHALFVSDAAAVMPFYTALFGWGFGADDNGVRPVTLAGQTIAHLHEVPDPAIRGKEEFWAVLFETDSLAKTDERVTRNQGEVLAQFDLPEGPAALVRDPDGAALILVETSTASTQSSALPWRAWLGLGLIIGSAFSRWEWLWAVFLGIWIIVGLRDRATWLFEPVTRAAQPLLFWLILGVYAILALFAVWGQI